MSQTEPVGWMHPESEESAMCFFSPGTYARLSDVARAELVPIYAALPYAGDMWDRFIDFIDKREGITHKNLLGGVEAYRRQFIVANMDASSSSLLLDREEAEPQTADSVHLSPSTNGPENLAEAVAVPSEWLRPGAVIPVTPQAQRLLLDAMRAILQPGPRMAFCPACFVCVSGDEADEQTRRARRYEFIRTLSPREFKELHIRNVNGGGPFDDLVDAAMAERRLAGLGAP